MYGLIAKLTSIPGKREELIGILKASAANMPGCFSYVVAQDSANEDTIWVTEVSGKPRRVALLAAGASRDP